MAGANLGTAYVTISPRFDGLSKSFRGALGGVDTTSAGKKMGDGVSRGFGKGIAAMGAVAGAASSLATAAMNAIGDSIGAAVSRVDTISNFPKVMENLGYGSEEAKASIDRLAAGIDGMPTSLDSIVSMTQQLAPLTGGLDNATTLSLALNDAFLAGGASTADQARAMQQYSQMLAKGSVDLQSWRTLQEVMPGQLNQVAQAMLGTGANANDLYEALQSGEVTMDDFNNTLVRLDTEGTNGFASFKEQAEASTAGIGTAMENVQNRIGKAIASIIDAIGQENISGAINAISSHFSDVAGVVVSVIDGIKSTVDFSGMSEALAPLGSVFEALGPVVQNVAQAFGAIVGSDITLTLGGIKAFLEPLSPAFEWAASALSKLSDSMTAIPDGPGAALAEVLSTVGDAIGAIRSAFGSFVGNAIAEVFELIATNAEALASVMPSLSDVVEWMRNAFEQAGSYLEDVFAPAFEAVGDAFSDISSRFGEAGDAVIDFGGIWEALSPVVSLVGNVLQAVAGFVLPLLSTAITTLAPIVAQAVDLWFQAAGAIGDVFNAIIQIVGGIAQLVGAILSFLAPAIEFIGSGIQLFAEGLIVGFGQLISLTLSIVSIVVSVFDAIVNFVAGIPAALVAFFSGLPEGIGAFFSGAKDLATGVISGLVSWVSGVPGAIIGFFSGIGSGIAAFFSDAKDQAVARFNEIRDKVSSIPDEIIGFFSSIPDKIAEMFSRIHVPSLHVEGGFNLDPANFSLPTISFYANGGVFTHAAVFGEAGPEMALPLNKKSTAPFAQSIAEHMDGGGSSREVVEWLADNLPRIIAEYTPQLGERDFDRRARRAYA